MHSIKFLIVIAPFFLFMGCRKKNDTFYYPDNGPKHFTIKVMDNQASAPLEGAKVTVIEQTANIAATYTAITDASGRASFTIDFMEGFQYFLSVEKNGYCQYYNNLGHPFRIQTILLDRIAYIRYHIKNIPPASASDRMVVYGPSYGFNDPFDFHGAGVDTVFYRPCAFVGNLGISCNRFTDTTFIESFYVNIVLQGGDTTDADIFY